MRQRLLLILCLLSPALCALCSLLWAETVHVRPRLASLVLDSGQGILVGWQQRGVFAGTVRQGWRPDGDHLRLNWSRTGPLGSWPDGQTFNVRPTALGLTFSSVQTSFSTRSPDEQGGYQMPIVYVLQETGVELSYGFLGVVFALLSIPGILAVRLWIARYLEQRRLQPLPCLACGGQGPSEPGRCPACGAESATQPANDAAGLNVETKPLAKGSTSSPVPAGAASGNGVTDATIA